MSRVLKVGKLDSDVLEELVIKKIKFKRPEVRTGAGIGEDCAVVDFGDYDCVISTDPITASVKDIGRLSVHISCNDIASKGVSFIKLLNGLLKVDNVNTVTLSENVLSHFGVPTSCLVSEMNAGFKKLFH